MTSKLILTVAAATLAAPMALADSDSMMGPSGDAAAGESLFRQCASCHVVTNAEGETLAGRGRTGPNLFGVAGRAAGSVEDFRYSPGLTATGEAGVVWDEESFAAFVQDPTAFVREATGDNGQRSSMSFRARSEEDALNLYAYLYSLAPAMMGDMMDDDMMDDDDMMEEEESDS